MRQVEEACNTVLIVLLLSAILVFIMHDNAWRGKTALNMAYQYYLDNLINRLHEK